MSTTAASSPRPLDAPSLPVSSIPETMPKWARRAIRDWGVWATTVAASFWWLERRGMRAKDDDAPTLTGVISRYVPGWAWFTALGAVQGWLGWHFQNAYESWRTSRPDYPR